MSRLGVEPIDPDDDDDDDQIAEGGAAAAPDPADPLASIRKDWERLKAEQTEDFEIPGYGGGLVVRYRTLDLETYRAALFNTPGTDLDRNAQFLIDACDQVLLQTDDGLVPVPDAPVPGWAGLEAVVGKMDEVKDIVLAVFAGNELVLADHSAEVERWMRSARDQAGDDLVGGS